MDKAEYMPPDRHDTLWAAYGDAQLAKLRTEQAAEHEAALAEIESERYRFMVARWEDERTTAIAALGDVPDLEKGQAIIDAACRHFETNRYDLLRKTRGRGPLRETYHVRYFVGQLVYELTDLKWKGVQALMNDPNFGGHKRAVYMDELFEGALPAWQSGYYGRSQPALERQRDDLAGILDHLDRGYGITLTFSQPDGLTTSQRFALFDVRREARWAQDRQDERTERETIPAATIEACEPPSSTPSPRRFPWWPARRSARD